MIVFELIIQGIRIIIRTKKVANEVQFNEQSFGCNKNNIGVSGMQEKFI